MTLFLNFSPFFYVDICKMLKTITFINILVFTTGLTSAQNFNAQLLAGVCASQVSGDGLAGFNKAGIMLGAGINTSVGKKASLGFEIYYIQKGSRKQNDVEKGDLEYYRLRLNYMEVPVLFHYQLSDNFGIIAGPSIGTLVGSTEEDQNGEIIGQPPFIKYEVSVCGGFKYQFSDNWGLYFRGSQSMVPVRNHSGGSVYRLNRGQYNSILMFTLFYQFENKTKKND